MTDPMTTPEPTAPAGPVLGESRSVREYVLTDLVVKGAQGIARHVNDREPDDGAYDLARAVLASVVDDVAALMAEQRERIAEAYRAMGLRGAAAIGGWQSVLSHPDCPDQGAARVDREAFHRFTDLLQGRRRRQQ